MKIKVKSLIAIIVLMGGLFCLKSNLRAANPETTSVLLKIYPALTLAKNKNLDFGIAFRGGAAATIPNTDAKAVTFTISTGQASTVVVVSYSTTSVSMTGPGTAIVVTLLPTVANNGTLTLNASGGGTFKVGGSRPAISASQAYGSYTGTFTTTVAYQ